MTAGPEPPPLKEDPKFEGLKKTFGPGEASALAQASAVGLTFVVAIVLGLAGGWWLDGRWGTSPLGLLLGLFIGIAAGFKNLFTFARRMEGLEREKRNKPRP
ncbi:MAG: AtpZ/AtpI family protein [Candidatus Adiutrix sp.]|jgi:F0F1-type ATP synthase assembly protein I|nr:AtpZ/AtpI family protein [Candidatus Adiutrix sp.]